MKKTISLGTADIGWITAFLYSVWPLIERSNNSDF
jgi:hypothetical protein